MRLIDEEGCWMPKEKAQQMSLELVQTPTEPHQKNRCDSIPEELSKTVRFDLKRKRDRILIKLFQDI